MKAVVTEMIWPEGLEILRRHLDVYYDPDLWKKPEELKSAAKNADAVDIKIGSGGSAKNSKWTDFLLLS